MNPEKNEVSGETDLNGSKQTYMSIQSLQELVYQYKFLYLYLLFTFSFTSTVGGSVIVQDFDFFFFFEILPINIRFEFVKVGACKVMIQLGEFF